MARAIQQGVRGHAVDLLDGGTDVFHLQRDGIADPERIRGRGGELGEALLAVAQRRLGLMAGRHVAGRAEPLGNGAVLVEEADRARMHPADAAVRPDDAVLHAVVAAGGQAGRHRRLDPVAVLGVDRPAQLVQRQRQLRVAAEDAPEAARAGQEPGRHVEAPGAQAAGLGGEAQPRRALLLQPPPLAHLGHQRGVVAFQPDEALALQRHVELARVEIRERAVRVVHRAEQQPVPERRAVLAVVADVDLEPLRTAHRGPQPAQRVLVRQRALQEAAVAPDDLRAVVAGQPAEGVVAEHHGVVRQPRVADHDRDRRRQHGRHQRVRPPCRAGQGRADARGLHAHEAPHGDRGHGAGIGAFSQAARPA